MRKSRSLGASVAAGATLLALVLSPVSAAYLFQASVIGQAFGGSQMGGQGQMMQKSMTKRFEKEIEKANKAADALGALDLTACEFEDPEGPTKKELSACKKVATKVLRAVNSGLRGLPLSDIDGVEDLMEAVMDCKRGECSGLSDAVQAAGEGIVAFATDRQTELDEAKAAEEEMKAERAEMEAERAEMENARKQAQQEKQQKRSEKQSSLDQEGQSERAFPSADKGQSGKGRFSMPTSSDEDAAPSMNTKSQGGSRFARPSESDSSSMMNSGSSNRFGGKTDGKASELGNPGQCPNGETGTPPNCSGARGGDKSGMSGGDTGSSRFGVGSKSSSSGNTGSNLGGSFMNPGQTGGGNTSFGPQGNTQSQGKGGSSSGNTSFSPQGNTNQGGSGGSMGGGSMGGGNMSGGTSMPR